MGSLTEKEKEWLEKGLETRVRGLRESLIGADVDPDEDLKTKLNIGMYDSLEKMIKVSLRISRFIKENDIKSALQVSDKEEEILESLLEKIQKTRNRSFAQKFRKIMEEEPNFWKRGVDKEKAVRYFTDRDYITDNQTFRASSLECLVLGGAICGIRALVEGDSSDFWEKNTELGEEDIRRAEELWNIVHELVPGGDWTDPERHGMNIDDTIKRGELIKTGKVTVQLQELNFGEKTVAKKESKPERKEINVEYIEKDKS